MASSFGENLKLSIFGTSHGPNIGMTLEGIPAGLPVDLEQLQGFLNRRAPGQNPWSTSRREADVPIFESGIAGGFTTGDPITATIATTTVSTISTTNTTAKRSIKNSKRNRDALANKKPRMCSGAFR